MTVLEEKSETAVGEPFNQCKKEGKPQMGF